MDDLTNAKSEAAYAGRNAAEKVETVKALERASGNNGPGPYSPRPQEANGSSPYMLRDSLGNVVARASGDHGGGGKRSWEK